MSNREEFSSRIRARHGKKVLLDDAGASNTFGWDKESAKRRTEKNLEALEDLQYQLYADNRKSLLIVLQGIDAGGKDGAIRNVASAFGLPVKGRNFCF